MVVMQLTDDSKEYLSDTSSKYLHIREAWDDTTSSWSSLDTYPQEKSLE